MFGRSTSKIYGLALLASGQSNTMTTSYSGQYIMQVIYNNGWIQGVSVPCIVHIKIHLPYIILILILYIPGENLKKSLYAWILEAVDRRESPSNFFLNDN